jgi:hypothetical protein
MGDPDVIAYKANGNALQRYDKVSNLRFLSLRLTGTLTHAGYGGAPTKLVEATENLISQVLLTATGKGSGTVSDPIKATDFAWLRFHTGILTGVAPTKTDIGTTNAAYAFESNCSLYLGDLNARALSSLLLQISFRDQTAMVTGGAGGTSVLSGVGVVVHGREVLGAVNRPSTRFLKESQLPFDVSATKQDFQLKDLPTGNTIMRMGFKGTVGATDYADPSDTLFANTSRAEGPHVRLEANSAYKVMDYIYGALRADNSQKFKMANPAGYSVWQPRAPWSARGVSTLSAKVDTNYTPGSTNTIQVTTVEIVNKAA